MTARSIVQNGIFLPFIFLFCFGCRTENHIDKYEVNVDSLSTLPDAFYAFRGGKIYYEDEKLEEYRIWFNLDNSGNAKSIYKIEDFADINAIDTTTIYKYNIDTTEKKILMQKFIDLSRRYKFGHIYVDRSNKISFSYRDGLSEQYVKTFNDSLNNIYARNKDFRLLHNGWFEYIER